VLRTPSWPLESETPTGGFTMQVLFVRLQEAAKSIGVRPSTLRRWHREGILTITKLSPRVVGYYRNALEAFVSGRGKCRKDSSDE
jgi:hypothetical protein